MAEMQLAPTTDLPVPQPVVNGDWTPDTEVIIDEKIIVALGYSDTKEHRHSRRNFKIGLKRCGIAYTENESKKRVQMTIRNLLRFSVLTKNQKADRFKLFLCDYYMQQITKGLKRKIKDQKEEMTRRTAEKLEGDREERLTIYQVDTDNTVYVVRGQVSHIKKKENELKSRYKDLKMIVSVPRHPNSVSQWANMFNELTKQGYAKKVDGHYYNLLQLCNGYTVNQLTHDVYQRNGMAYRAKGQMTIEECLDKMKQKKMCPYICVGLSDSSSSSSEED